MKLNKEEYYRIKDMIQSSDQASVTVGLKIMERCVETDNRIYLLLLYGFYLESDERMSPGVPFNALCPNVSDYLTRLRGGIFKWDNSKMVYARAYNLALKISKEKAQFVLDEVNYIFKSALTREFGESFGASTMKMEFKVNG